MIKKEHLTSEEHNRATTFTGPQVGCRPLRELLRGASVDLVSRQRDEEQTQASTASAAPPQFNDLSDTRENLIIITRRLSPSLISIRVSRHVVGHLRLKGCLCFF